MKQRKITVPKDYFTSSMYAHKLQDELENDAEGLMFDAFIHEIGAFLHLDIVYEKATRTGDNWFLGSDSHVQVLLKESEEEYQLILSPLSEHGDHLIHSLSIDSRQLEN